jgi:hypothetical protein
LPKSAKRRLAAGIRTFSPRKERKKGKQDRRHPFLRSVFQGRAGHPIGLAGRAIARRRAERILIEDIPVHTLQSLDRLFEPMPPKSLLPDRPHPRNSEDVRGRWAWFAKAPQQAASAVILYIRTERISHWSVLTGVIGDRLALYDSTGTKTIVVTATEPYVAIAITR